MPKLKLKTTLHRQDIKGSWTYLVIRDAAKIFDSKGHIQVKGTIDSLSVEGTLQSRGDGSHWFPVKKEWREAIGKTIGDAVDVIFEDTILSYIEPDDLSKALAKNKKASAQWKKFTESKKKYYIVWIEGAKQEETRKRRVTQSIEKIEKGLNQHD